MFFFFCLSKTFFPQTAFHSPQFLSFHNSYHHHPKYIIQQIHQMIAQGLGLRETTFPRLLRLGHMIVFTTEYDGRDLPTSLPFLLKDIAALCFPQPSTPTPHIFFLWAETQVTFAAQLRPSRKRQMLGCSKG